MATSMEDLRILQSAERLGDEIWNEVLKWDEHAKRTVGEQLVRAADSIGANIAESYGRYAYGEKIQFLLYARGSLFETKFWLRRTMERNLVTAEKVDELAQQLDLLAKEVNGFIRSLRSQKSAGKGMASRDA